MSTVEIARDCAAHEPDLFVVYMGNNEVIGPFGPGTVFQLDTQPVDDSGQSLVEIDAVRAVAGRCRRLFRPGDRTAGHWRRMELFLDNPVPADDPRLASVYDDYRRNLTEICRVGRRAGAAVVVSTMAVNLRDCPPLASAHRSALSAEELAQWESIYKTGCDLEAKGNWQDRARSSELRGGGEDRRPLRGTPIPHRPLPDERRPLGRGAERFELARDLDVLRFRADSRLNAVIREVAEEQAANGVRFADAPGALAASADHGILGGDLFYEHVHFTFAGNYLLARTFCEQVCQALPQLASSGKQGEMPSLQRCAELLALTPWDEYDLVVAMVDMTARKPFTNQLDHGLRMAAALKRRDDLQRRATTPEAQQAAWKTYEAAIAQAPDDWELHLHFGKLALHYDQSSAAVEQFRIVVQRLPWDDTGHHSLGFALARQGNADEAITEYRKAVELNPEFAQAYNDLGLALKGRGATDEAIAQYRKALEIGPELAEARINLGHALTDRGDVDQAIAEYEKGLEINPGLAAAHIELGIILNGRGQINEAIAQFRKALEIQPNNSETCYNLGVLLAGSGNINGAIALYTRVLQINPDYADAHVNLGAILDSRRQSDAAAAHYRRALAIKPDYADAYNNLGVVLAREGQADEAIVNFQKALAIKPDYAQAYNNLGMALAGRRKLDEAIVNFQKARWKSRPQRGLSPES